MSKKLKADLRRSIDRLTYLRDVFKKAKKIEGGYAIPVGEGRVLFDISNWVMPLSARGGYWEGTFDTSISRTGLRNEPLCGTAACIAGTAGLIPKFRRAGLITDFASYGGPVRPIRLRSDTEGDLSTSGSFDKFFGLQPYQGYHIHDPGCYETERMASDELAVTPKMAVKHINDVLKQQRASLRKAAA